MLPPAFWPTRPSARSDNAARDKLRGKPRGKLDSAPTLACPLGGRIYPERQKTCARLNRAGHQRGPRSSPDGSDTFANAAWAIFRVRFDTATDDRETSSPSSTHFAPAIRGKRETRTR